MSKNPDSGGFLGEPIGDPVVLVDYDESWHRRFDSWKGRLQGVLGPVAQRVDHIGSTAVPGLSAKPVVDIQVSVDDIEDEDSYRPAIESLGLQLRFRAPDRRFFRLPKGESRTVHVHVCQARSERESNTLLFAAYLRTHPERRDAYAALKRDLARRFACRRAEYLEGKEDLIAETISLARQWAEKSGYHVRENL